MLANEAGIPPDGAVRTGTISISICCIGKPERCRLSPSPLAADHSTEMPDASADPASTPLDLHNQDGQPIATVEDWFRLALPARGALRWNDGRSAKETAKAWLRSGVPAVPTELSALLDSHPLTHRFVGREAIPEAIPEAVIRLDDLAGGQRNADMLVAGAADGQRVVVTVESKVDEPFGEVIGGYYDSHPPPTSRVQDRIYGLVQAAFGRGLDEEVRGLRYQLLHGTAGTLAAAGEQGARVAVFIAHVFETGLADEEKLARNREDWDRFVGALSGMGTAGEMMGAGDGAGLLGPFTVPGGGRVPGGLAQTQPLDPVEFAVRLALGGRMWLAESLFSADFQGFPLAGIPDAVCLEDGKAADVHEYKFTDSTQLQMSHRVQLLIYGYLLEESGFDVSNLVLTCVLVPRRFASEQEAVITPESANLIRDAVADVARRQKASQNWKLANFPLAEGINVIVRAFRYDRAGAERELTFFTEFWSGTRMAWPTSKPEKCSRCLYNSLRRCNSSLIRYGAAPTN